MIRQAIFTCVRERTEVSLIYRMKSKIKKKQQKNKEEKLKQKPGTVLEENIWVATVASANRGRIEAPKALSRVGMERGVPSPAN